MFESIVNFFKRFGKNEKENSKTTAKERLHLVLAQDRANISADFLEMMKQEIIEVIKKYIDIDEEAIDVRMTNKPGEDGTMGAPALYANIPIVTIKNEARKLEGTIKEKQEEKQIEQNKEIDSNEKNEETESTVEEKSTNQLEAKEEQDKKEQKEEAIEGKKDKLEENSENKQKEIKMVENKVEKPKNQKQASEKGNEKKATSNHNNKKRKKNK